MISPLEFTLKGAAGVMVTCDFFTAEMFWLAKRRSCWPAFATALLASIVALDSFGPCR